jgi:hypothetical protein
MTTTQNLTKTEALQCAEIIMQQLGGSRFAAMTGARDIGFMSSGAVTFKIGRNPRGMTHCKVSLDRSRDLYTMTFYSGRALKIRVAAQVEGVYADQLAEVFTLHTDLLTSL